MSKNISTLEAFRHRARNTNVNDVTLLATDYLNHFNEALMLAELIPDMPDMLGDFIAWSPNSYKDHFRESGVADREFAIAAYDVAPPEYRRPFEVTTDQLDTEILSLQEKLAMTQSQGRGCQYADVTARQCMLIRQLIDRAGCIINGQVHSRHSERVTEEGDVDYAGLDQGEIDALFD